MSNSFECPGCQQAFLSDGPGDAKCPRCGQLCSPVTTSSVDTAVRPRLGVLVGTPAHEPPTREAPAPGSRRAGVPVEAPRYARAEWSVLALTLGLTALAITWPLRAWQLGLVLGGLGTLMAATAFLLACVRKQASLELPTIALVVNTQAVIMAILLTRTPEPAPQHVEVPVVRLQSMTDLRAGLKSDDPDTRAKTLAGLRDVARDLDAFKADLLVALHDEQAQVRGAAAGIVGHVASAAKLAYPALDSLRQDDPDAGVRQQAETALKKIAPPSRDDLPELLAALNDTHAAVRAAAAQTLALLGAEAQEATAALDRLLADGEAAVRVSAAEALWEITKQQAPGLVPKLVSGLSDPSAAVRVRAATALGSMRSSDARTLEALTAALGDASSHVRLKAAWALAGIGPPAQNAVPRLMQALEDGDAKVRLFAAQAVWNVATRTDCVAVLGQLLRHKELEIRAGAAAALEVMGPEARVAVFDLGAALKDVDPGVRQRAAKALFNLGPEARVVLEGMQEALQAADPDLRAAAALAMGNLGAEGRAAVPKLRRAMEDVDAGVRLSAAQALWRLEHKADDLLPVLTQALKDRDATVRARAAATLGNFGGKAGTAVPELFALLSDADESATVAAIKALGNIGGSSARTTYLTLAELAKDEQPVAAVRTAAATALKRIGRPSRTDVHTLIAALDHKDAAFRASVVVVLWSLNRDAKPAVVALSKRLADSDEAVRQSAAVALAAIGPDAADAVPALLAALERKDDEVLRTRAAYALGEIGVRAKTGVPVLRKLLENPAEKLPLRVYAAQALWAIAQETRDVIATLSKGLEKADEIELKAVAVETLGKIGARAVALDADVRQALKEQAVPALQQGLREEQAHLRAASATALGTLGIEARDALPALLQALEDKEAEIRAVVAETLGKIAVAESQASKRGVRGKAAYAALLFHSKVDHSDRVQRAAAGALLKMGRLGPDDVDVLLSVLEDKNQSTAFRSAAAQVLGLLGPEAAKAVGRLGRVVADREQGDARALAAYALGEVGPDARGELTSLLAALREGSPALQVAAAYALGEIFAANRTDVPGLVDGLRQASASTEENVAAAARAALKKIQTPM